MATYFFFLGRQCGAAVLQTRLPVYHDCMTPNSTSISIAGDDGSAPQASVGYGVVIDVRMVGWRNLLLMLVDKGNVQFYTCR